MRVPERSLQGRCLELAEGLQRGKNKLSGTHPVHRGEDVVAATCHVKTAADMSACNAHQMRFEVEVRIFQQGV